MGLVNYLRTHKELIPLFGCVVVGAGVCTYAILRTAMFHPEISWKSSNPSPWNKIAPNEVTKFMAIQDISKRKHGAPTEALEAIKNA